MTTWKGGSWRTSVGFTLELWLLQVFPEKFLEGVPAMPTVVDSSEECTPEKWKRIADQLSNDVCLQHAQALVHRVLSRKEIEEDPKAGEAIRKEAQEVRQMNVWDDSSVCEVDDLRQKAKAAGEKIHIAEVMEIGSIKHDELGPSLSRHKGRLVFRADAAKDQDGLPAKFRELQSQPASIQTVS